MSFLNYLKFINSFDLRLAIAVYAKVTVLCIVGSYVIGFILGLIRPKSDLRTAGRVGMGFWVLVELAISIQKLSPLVGNVVFHMVWPYSIVMVGPGLGIAFLAFWLWTAWALSRRGLSLGRRLRGVRAEEPAPDPTVKQRKTKARGQRA